MTYGGALGAAVSCRAASGRTFGTRTRRTVTFGGLSCRAMHRRTFATSSITTIFFNPITCRTTAGEKYRIGSSTTTSGGSGGAFGNLRRRRLATTLSGCRVRQSKQARLFRALRHSGLSHTRCRFLARGSFVNQRPHSEHGRLSATETSRAHLSPVYGAAAGGSVLTGTPGSVLGSGEVGLPSSVAFWRQLVSVVSSMTATRSGMREIPRTSSGRSSRSRGGPSSGPRHFAFLNL